jgi:hypothetical protein
MQPGKQFIDCGALNALEALCEMQWHESYVMAATAPLLLVPGGVLSFVMLCAVVQMSSLCSFECFLFLLFIKARCKVRRMTALPAQLAAIHGCTCPAAAAHLLLNK